MISKGCTPCGSRIQGDQQSNLCPTQLVSHSTCVPPNLSHSLLPSPLPAPPCPGACGGMYTANTMSSSIEALGMSVPYSSSIPAVDPLKMDECRLAGRQARGGRPSAICADP